MTTLVLGALGCVTVNCWVIKPVNFLQCSLVLSCRLLHLVLPMKGSMKQGPCVILKYIVSCFRRENSTVIFCFLFVLLPDSILPAFSCS